MAFYTLSFLLLSSPLLGTVHVYLFPATHPITAHPMSCCSIVQVQESALIVSPVGEVLLTMPLCWYPSDVLGILILRKVSQGMGCFCCFLVAFMGIFLGVRTYCW